MSILAGGRWSFEFTILNKRLSGQLQQISQHAHRRDRCAGTGALHNERARTVPLGVEQNNVIRAPKRSGEWVVRGILFESRAHMPVRDVDDADEAKDLSLHARLDAQVVELSVEFGEACEELVAGGDALKRGGDEGRGLHG